MNNIYKWRLWHILWRCGWQVSMRSTRRRDDDDKRTHIFRMTSLTMVIRRRLSRQSPKVQRQSSAGRREIQKRRRQSLTKRYQNLSGFQRSPMVVHQSPAVTVVVVVKQSGLIRVQRLMLVMARSWRNPGHQGQPRSPVQGQKRRPKLRHRRRWLWRCPKHTHTHAHRHTFVVRCYS